MSDPFSYRARRPTPGSLLDSWLERRTPHPDSFDCGVRVVEGHLEGEGRRWRFRRSAVDPLIVDGVVSLNHGTKIRLELVVEADRFEPARRHRARSGHVVISAVERGSAARVQLSVPIGELERFGVEY